VASIKLNSLIQKPTKSNTGYTYNDLHLDFTPVFYTPPYGAYTQNNELLHPQEIIDVVADYDLGAIANSIRNIFSTIPGQKILNPLFGLNLVQYVFEACTEEMAGVIGNEIVSGITTFEPRISLTNVNVIAQPDQQQYNITISFSVPAIGTTSFSLNGTLSTSGFNYTTSQQ
jgi:phage baseplate assembly protein W